MAENQITLTKRICMASDGYQFLTSGFPNRSRDKKTFDSVDGLFIKKPILEDLRPTETDMEGDSRGRQGIEVDFTIYRTRRRGTRKWWVFGYRSASRAITQYKPRDVKPGEDSTIATVKHGTMYLDNWCCHDYFPDIAAGSVFPVYVKVTRKEGSV